MLKLVCSQIKKTKTTNKQKQTHKNTQNLKNKNKNLKYKIISFVKSGQKHKQNQK